METKVIWESSESAGEKDIILGVVDKLSGCSAVESDPRLISEGGPERPFTFAALRAVPGEFAKPESGVEFDLVEEAVIWLC